MAACRGSGEGAFVVQGDSVRPSWRLPNPQLPSHRWRDIDVLLEFNGPQLVLVDGGDGVYLSVASDESERTTRWLRSRLSPLEQKALLSGATTVREAIIKSEIWVVDTDRAGEVIMEAAVAPDALSEDDLPTADSVLPDETLQAHRSDMPAPAVFLDGPAVSDHAIGFRALADILQQIQRLWNAIGQTLLGRSTAKGPVPQDIVHRTELMLGNLVPGSVGLRLRPVDEQLFTDIAQQYARLILASGDQVQLGAVLRELKARVRATYADYLNTLQKHRVEVLTRWERQGIFISSTMAARIEPALESVDAGQEERFEARGYFIGFNQRGADFEFMDPDSDEHYKGRVSPEVLRSPVLIVIGPSKRYVVGISIITAHSVGGSPRNFITLESVQECPGGGESESLGA